jgi:hypothetical protein
MCSSPFTRARTAADLLIHETAICRQLAGICLVSLAIDGPLNDELSRNRGARRSRSLASSRQQDPRRPRWAKGVGDARAWWARLCVSPDLMPSTSFFRASFSQSQMKGFRLYGETTRRRTSIEICGFCDCTFLIHLLYLLS